MILLTYGLSLIKARVAFLDEKECFVGFVWFFFFFSFLLGGFVEKSLLFDD
eukprot:m.248255 g.248255  ORF g.248255 m.248255 type:complete len:51 (+) comp57770_c0_seq1:80-232(+)